MDHRDRTISMSIHAESQNKQQLPLPLSNNYPDSNRRRTIQFKSPISHQLKFLWDWPTILHENRIIWRPVDILSLPMPR